MAPPQNRVRLARQHGEHAEDQLTNERRALDDADPRRGPLGDALTHQRAMLAALERLTTMSHAAVSLTDSRRPDGAE